MRDDERPDPDALLAQITADEVRAKRARLKIFFGASPGVGKTYTMLEAAQRECADGVDLIVGIVETHGRADTAALIDGLPMIPRRTVDHRGVGLDELDLEAALARKPALLIVDELAHTNAPGSRHVKRWQDVIDLLDAGIDVWTTLNVQHIESLGDVIQQITGIVVRETVPDAVVARADELELVDLPPEELLERLADGKVYVPEQIARAAQHFFQRGNLLALRELALRHTAERVDADVLAYRREHGIAATWPTRDRIVVGIGPSPGSERLIRATKRMAEGLRAPWSAVTVEVLGAPPHGARDRDRLEAHLRLAEQLGGEVVRLRGARIAEAILAYAREHNVTRLVAGKPTHARWRDRLRGSLLDELIRGSGQIEVHVIAPLDPSEPPPPVAPAPEEPGSLPYVGSVLAITAVTAIGLAAFSYIGLADITMLYLIAIMLASLTGRGPALLASSLAVAALDFCFVPPRFTFAVSDVRHVLTFAVMFASGLVISTLTVRLRRQEREAIDRERRTAALLLFTREVASADDEAEVAAVVARHLEDGLDAAVAVLVPAPDGGLVAAAGLMPLAGPEETVARWAFEHRRSAGRGTDTLPGARVLAIPLVDATAAIAVIALQRRKGATTLRADELHLLDALVRQSTVALARVRRGTQVREGPGHASESADTVPSDRMSTSDRIFPLCELLLGAAYADGELHPKEKTEIRALLVELAGELRVEVEACIASFEPDKFDPSSVIGIFRDDTEEERQKLLLLVSMVIEADDEIDLAENDYLRRVATSLALPPSALTGLAVDVEVEEIKDTFNTVRRGPPPPPVTAPRGR